VRAVVLVESCFGCTAAVARAVAEGLRSTGAEVEVLDAASAPAELRADLVLVGAPTHNTGLPTPASRRQAATTGAPRTGPGVREWIDRVAAVDGRVVAFSTKVGSRFAGSAGKAAVRALERRGVTAERGEDFVVTGTAGPLAEGETARAEHWGRGLAGVSAGR